MFKLKYLSPSALLLWRRDKSEFYRRYILGIKPVYKSPEMHLGSCFDEMVKCEIQTQISGTSDCEFPDNDDARFLLERYKKFGRLSELISGIRDSKEWLMEETVESECFDIPILGIPDLYYLTKEGVGVIIDFKVSKQLQRGFIRKDCAANTHDRYAMPSRYQGFSIDVAGGMPYHWKFQLIFYSILISTPVHIIGIDHIYPTKGSLYEFSERVTEGMKMGVRQQIVDCWEIINSDHFFRDLSKEESQEKEQKIRKTQIIT